MLVCGEQSGNIVPRKGLKRDNTSYRKNVQVKMACREKRFVEKVFENFYLGTTNLGKWLTEK